MASCSVAYTISVYMLQNINAFHFFYQNIWVCTSLYSVLCTIVLRKLHKHKEIFLRERSRDTYIERERRKMHREKWAAIYRDPVFFLVFILLPFLCSVRLVHSCPVVCRTVYIYSVVDLFLFFFSVVFFNIVSFSGGFFGDFFLLFGRCIGVPILLLAFRVSFISPLSCCVVSYNRKSKSWAWGSFKQESRWFSLCMCKLKML